LQSSINDAQGLFKKEKSIIYLHGRSELKCQDIEHFSSWSQLGRDVRVVRSLETKNTRRQSTGKLHYETSEWVWVGTISKEKLSTEDFVKLAHGRWKIENNGFNELVTYWHADHIYKHNPVSIENFLLLILLTYVIFHIFICRNLKAQIRAKYTKQHLAKMIICEFYSLSFPAFIPPYSVILFFTQ